MHTSLRTLAAIGLVALSIPHLDRQEDGREPPQRFTLQVGAETRELLLDEPVELELGGETLELVLRARETRVFRLEGLEFEYLSFLAFETEDLGDGARTWRLDGSSVVLSVTRFGVLEPVELCQTMATATLTEFGGDAVDLTPAAITLDGEVWHGLRFPLALGGILLDYSFYAATVGEHTYVLGILDSLNAEDRRTDETSRTFELLEETFRVR